MGALRRQIIVLVLCLVAVLAAKHFVDKKLLDPTMSSDVPANRDAPLTVEAPATATVAQP